MCSLEGNPSDSADRDLAQELCALPDEQVCDWLQKHQSRFSRDAIETLRLQAQEVGYHGDLVSALHLLDRAAQAAAMLSDPLTLALVWRGRANVLQVHEKYAESLDASQQAVAIYERHGTPFDVAVARTVQVNDLGGLERFDEAVDLALRIRPLFKRRRFTLGQATLAHNLAQILTWAWRLDEAVREYRLARRLFLRLDDKTQAARVLHNLGVAAEQLDQLEQARRYYTRALPELVAASDVSLIIKTKFNLALLYLRQGRYEAALEQIAQARADVARLPDSPDVGYIDLAEGRVRAALNQYDLAQDLLRQALVKFELQNRDIESAETLLDLGHATSQRATPALLAESLACFENAETHLRRLTKPLPLLLAWLQLQQAEILLRLERVVEAARQAQNAHDVFTASGLALRAAQAAIVLADCQLLQNREEAQREYESALKVVKESVPLLAARCWRGLGRAAVAAGDLAIARRDFESALEQLEVTRRALHGHSHQAGFFEDKQPVIDELLSVLHTLPHAGYDLLGALERFKASALADLLIGQPLDQQIDHQLAELLSEREALLGELDHHASMALANHSQLAAVPQRGPALAASDRDQSHALSHLRRQLRMIDEQIAGRTNSAFDWRRSVGLDSAQIHQLLGEHTLLISYYTIHDRLYALTATNRHGDLEKHALLVTQTEINRRWQEARLSTTQSNGNLSQAILRLSLLWKDLLAPLSARLAGKAHVIIIPHRGLFHLPFAALYDSGAGKYVAEQWSLQLAPSLTVLTRCRQQPAAIGRPLLVGYPGQQNQPSYLSGVAPEIKNVSERFGNAEVLFGDDATLATVLRSVPGRSVVHLAGHAFYDSREPLMSGMPLASGRWLRASDLYLRHGYFQGSTVVMSGCNAGRGSTTGHDILGLSSGFLYAGVASVLAGLWHVDDAATTKLMTGFYEHWLNGNTAAEALRLAQIDLIHGAEYGHPYYWAPFYLSGDNRRLNLASRPKCAARPCPPRQPAV